MLFDDSDRIFENYEMFIKEHKNQIDTPHDAIEMLSSDGAFRAYIDALTEGLDVETKTNIFKIAEREREMLLEESINIGPTASVVGYAVTYFPILTDIYSDPIISKIATLYPTDKPIVTIPRITIESSVKNSDGTTSKFRIPEYTTTVRTKPEIITLTPGISNSLHGLSAGGMVTVENAFVNKRYFLINNIRFVNSAGTVINRPIVLRPDARGQLNTEFTYVDPNSNTYKFTIIGNTNWDTGIVQFSFTINNVTAPAATIPSSMRVTSIDASVIFSARRGDVGRVKVGIKTEGWDINVDVRDSFEIQLDQEVIQDFSDIYEIDMLRTLSSAIKQQMLYNKEGDLAYFLKAYEPEFASFGSYSQYNMQEYTRSAGSGDFAPANILDIFKGVIPHITTVNRNIYRNFRATPQYLVSGLKTASLLEALQSYMVGFQSNDQGSAGFTSHSSVIDFRRQTVLASDMLPDDRIYFVYKAPNDDLSRTALTEILYKPLYVIEEIDESQRRTYVKSRSAFELTAPHSMGYIEMTNYSDYI